MNTMQYAPMMRYGDLWGILTCSFLSTHILLYYQMHFTFYIIWFLLMTCAEKKLSLH